MTTTNLFTEVEDMSIPAGLPSTSHSMAYALMPFCNGKVPIEHISAALASQTTHDPISFLVAGVHAGAASEFAASRGLNDLGNPIWDASVHSDAAKSKSSKRFNFERPKLFSARYKSNGRSCYVLTVMPGRDYVLHYAWMVRQVVDQLSAWTSTDFDLRAEYFPEIEASYYKWSGLSQAINKVEHETHCRLDEAAIVVVGAVDEVRNRLLHSENHEFHTLGETVSCRMFHCDAVKWVRDDGETKRAIFIGCEASYWGTMAARVCETLYARGAREVLYVGKLGSVRRASDVYNVLACPSQFYFSNHPFQPRDQVAIASPQLGLNKWVWEDQYREEFGGSEFLLGGHVSVPTILGETVEQIEAMQKRGVTSIDNEIYHMAQAAEAAGKVFSCLHFVTDFVRNAESKGIITCADLGKSSVGSEVSENQHRKWDCIGKIAMIVGAYFTGPCGQGLDTVCSGSARCDSSTNVESPVDEAISMSTADEVMLRAKLGGCQMSSVLALEVAENHGGPINHPTRG